MHQSTIAMLKLRYNSDFRKALLIVAFGLVVGSYVLEYSHAVAARFNACFIRREVERPPPTLIPLGDSQLHNLSVYVMWFAMFVLSILPRGRVAALHSLTLASLWFHTTYIILAAAKAPLDDYNCTGRHPNFPNGISGHYCYFIFVMLTAPRFAHMRIRANPHLPQSILILVSFLIGLFTVGAIATLYRTFFHGYHSVRQIIFGVALGLASHVALDSFHFAPLIPSPEVTKFAFLLANSLTAVAFYLRLWPHNQAEPAIGYLQFLFHGGLWLILLVTGLWIPRNPPKEATD